jgi:hypothetical protein
MLKTLLTCTATCWLAAGCASAPTTPKPAAATAANTATTNCAGPGSASRLPQSNCGPGQSYSQDDIRSTGQTGVAGALPMLDPIVHH